MYDNGSQPKEDTMQYKVIQAVQENGPNYWLIFKGVKVFGATPIARCDHEADARLIVELLNATVCY